MEQANPFRAPGVWLKGNTHSHSTESDGKLSVADRFAQYREGGYQFLVLTDHRKVNDVSPHSTPEFLAISGSEVHPANPYGGDRYHFVAINIHERIQCETLGPNETLEEIKAQGGLAVVCHPHWCGHLMRDILPLKGYFAVEVYNDTCEQLIGKGHSEAHWDALLDEVGPVWGIAADDAHGITHDVFHAWIMVKAAELSVPALMDGLRKGAFYSSQGPEILDVSVAEEEVQHPRGGTQVRPVVRVSCSPARAIAFKAQRSSGKRFLAPQGETLTTAAYPVMGGEKYIRVEITDIGGKKAWSNPVFF
jgi:hypothetical protein